MNQGGTSVTFSTTPSNVVAGEATTLSAQVAPTLGGRPAPTGTGSFFDGTAALGSVTLSNGGASVQTSALTVGPHTINFAYSGDANFQPNTASASFTITAPPPSPDFTLSATTASLTVSSGQTASTQLTINATSELSGQVTFRCSGLPVESTCTFAPANVTAEPGQASTTTLTISTAAPSSAMLRRLAAPALAALLLAPFCNTKRLRRLQLSLMIGLLTIGATSMLGCGGMGSPSNPANPGSPAGSYTVTVTATATVASTQVSHTLPLTLVIH
jgi:hypothetical protein